MGGTRVRRESDIDVTCPAAARIAPPTRGAAAVLQPGLHCGALVAGERRGRSVVHAMHAHHVAELLDHAVHHVEHPRPAISDTAG